jgi:predicted metalloprotease
MEKEEWKECQHCELCCPEDYTCEVDISFLKMCKNMYNKLKEFKKGYYVASGWEVDIDKAIEKARENGQIISNKYKYD